jgi:hypothetical protein
MKSYFSIFKFHQHQIGFSNVDARGYDNRAGVYDRLGETAKAAIDRKKVFELRAKS